MEEAIGEPGVGEKGEEGGLWGKIKDDPREDSKRKGGKGKGEGGLEGGVRGRDCREGEDGGREEG